MNVLMVPSWYAKDEKGEFLSGTFHFEQAIDLQKYCNIAIFYPFDQIMKERFSEKEEGGY